jgi:hypothetical protein
MEPPKRNPVALRRTRPKLDRTLWRTIIGRGFQL